MQKKQPNHLSSWGPVYWNVFLYRRAMNLLRPRGRDDVFAWIAREIGSLSILELCSGDGTFRSWVPANSYQAIEKNPAFVRHLRNEKTPVIEADIMTSSWPDMDCLIMIDSLYHFIDNLEPLMDRVRRSRFQKVIFSESTINYSLSRKGWLSKFAVWATRVDGRPFPKRFSEKTLRTFFKENGFQCIESKPPYLIGVWVP